MNDANRGPYSGVRITRDELRPVWLKAWEAHKDLMLTRHGPDACWPSCLGKSDDRRVRLASGRKAPYARCIVAAEEGEIAEGLPARHSCGRADCCNPSHLMPGGWAVSVACPARRST
jgi:hypothetical protein